MRLSRLLPLFIALTLALPGAAQRWNQYELPKKNLYEKPQEWYEVYKVFFKDDVCSVLKDEYQKMSDEELQQELSGFPDKLIEFALKAKNNTWDSFEKDFRVQTFKPYSSSYKWAKYMNVYQYSDLQSPTGIIGCNEYIYVFVSENVPEDVFMYIDVVPDNSSYAFTDHSIKPGLNVFKLADTEGERRMMFLDYRVDTDTTATSKKLSDYPNVSLHIEGGHVYGYFDAARHDNAFWEKMLARQEKDSIAALYKGIQAKGEKVLFQMFRSSLLKGCPEKITEALELWDETIKRQHLLMGAEQYYDRWNDLIMARSDDSGGGFYASPTFTYYNDYALSGMLSPEYIYKNPGTLWTSAHEIGHVNQGAINILGCTESSNNLFSNMNIHLLGKTTTRGNGVANCALDFLNRVPFPKRTSDPIGVSRMFFQLYLYFHVAGKMPDFYPRLFEALRKDPLQTKDELNINAKKDQLKFAEKCCEIAQMDLSEFFEAWGFFETMNEVNIEDYRTNIATLTWKDAQESRAYMQQYEKKGGHLMFIEDRIKPSERTDGVAGSRIDFDDVFAIGKMGEYGQWGDYIDESVKAEGYYYGISGNWVKIYKDENAKGALGFKAYDTESGKMVGFTNGNEIEIPTAYAGRELVVVAAQADGSDYTLPGVECMEGEEMEYLALGNTLSSLYKYTVYTTEDINRVGYYYTHAVKELCDIYEDAEKAYEKKDTGTYTYRQWNDMLKKAAKKINENLEAFIRIDNCSIYKLNNRGYMGYYMHNDAMGIKGIHANNINNWDEATWFFEKADEEDYFYIRNEDGRYVNDFGFVGAMCSGHSKEEALLFKINYHSNATVFFTEKESGLFLAMNEEKNIIGIEYLSNNSSWIVTRIGELTAIEEIEEEKACNDIFDLHGRKVTNPKKGIYIQNGKKVYFE